MLSVKPVRVQGPRFVELNYDVCLNGKPIDGMRYERKGRAVQDMDRLQRSVEFKRYQQAYGGGNVQIQNR